MRRAGRLWFRDSCGGISWEHRLVNFTTLCRLADGVEVHALTVEDHRCVYYLETEPLDVLKHLYLHELSHRIALNPGALDHMMKIYGADNYDQYCEREELHSSYVAGPMAEACGKFLRLPTPSRAK